MQRRRYDHDEKTGDLDDCAHDHASDPLHPRSRGCQTTRRYEHRGAHGERDGDGGGERGNDGNGERDGDVDGEKVGDVDGDSERDGDGNGDGEKDGDGDDGGARDGDGDGDGDGEYRNCCA